jgi:hypothetical protein
MANFPPASIATATKLGLVKGSGIASDGTLTPIIATSSSLGSIIVGANIALASDGTISTLSPGSSENTTSLGFSNITTSATPTTGATVQATQFSCTALIVKTQAQALEYQRNGSGSFYTIRPYEEKYIYGITNASQIAFRRKDYLTARTTQVTRVQYELLNTSSTYVITNLLLATSTNNSYSFFGNNPCTSIEITNTGNKDVNIRKYNVVSGSVNVQAVFVGSISTTTLTVSSVTSGVIEIGMQFNSNTIVALGTGTGGVGTYILSVSQSASGTYTAIHFLEIKLY